MSAIRSGLNGALAGTRDVIVCGGGPAGLAAAITAARAGARTLLLENQGCLGGVWTSGALAWIIDYENKGGLMAEILARLEALGARPRNSRGEFTKAYPIEAMKLVVETLCLEAGVEVLLHTRVVAGVVDADTRRVTHVIVESASGREAYAARAFVDATGNGDFAARVGCGFDLGHPESGECQPLSLMAVVAGLDADKVAPYVVGSGVGGAGAHWAKDRLLADIRRAGIEPSYTWPTLFQMSDGLFALMANHEYGVRCDDARGLSEATLRARREIWRIVTALRGLGGVWGRLELVTTGAQIGIREGRRIHGVYTVTRDDLARGARFEDAVCRATFGVDIHSTNPAKGRGAGSEGHVHRDYDIPLRALVAKDVEGLLLAGRCISGDFFAHASYRVTGNAVPMGEAAGTCAARWSRA